MFSSVASSVCRAAAPVCRSEVSFNIEKRSVGFFNKLLGVRNECLSVRIGNNESLIDLKKVYKEVDCAIKHFGGQENKGGWLCQETSSYLSSEINRTIDGSCLKNNVSITQNQKNRIFKKLFESLGGVVRLDPRCTQSSINHMMQNSRYVTGKIDKLALHENMKLHDSCQLQNKVKYQLTDIIFEKKFGGVNAEQLRHETRREFQNQVLHRRSAPC
ncbi:TPA: hypothetical protein ACPFI9_003818 [Providencia rettgeri]